MENEKLQINLAPGVSRAEVILREGAASKVLDPKPPLKIEISGTINCVHEWLKKRIEAEQFCQKDCHILVDRDNVVITLITNETDEYRRGKIVGKLSYNPKFVEFGINSGRLWTPSELGLFFKMNRIFFTDRITNMQLVTDLMNFTAEVNDRIDRSIKENGNRVDNFTQVVNSNLPSSFNLNIPIFKGMPSEILEVETFAQINGREVSFTLLSPGAKAVLEDLRNKVINEQLALIAEVAPEIAIIEV